MSRFGVLVILLSLVSFAALSSQATEVMPPRLRQTNSSVGSSFEVGRDGRYIMRYETPAGIIHFETGYVRLTAVGLPYPVKEGYYIYPTADGRRVRVDYFADNLGYRVVNYQIRSNSVEDPEEMQPTSGDKGV